MRLESSAIRLLAPASSWPAGMDGLLCGHEGERSSVRSTIVMTARAGTHATFSACDAGVRSGGADA
jgi:hypothetical protein